MKITIVNVSRSRMNKNVEYYLLTLKAYINNSGAGIEAEILDIFLTDDIATSAGFLKNRDSSILLFYVQFWNCSYILKLTDQCRKPGNLIGVWGHDTFSHPEEYLKKEIDFIIQDEPELPLFELALLKKRGESISGASGIIFKDRNKKTFIFGENKVLNDLDLIPSPYTNGMVDVDESTVVFWEVARGCLFRCNFCVEFSHSGNVRYHSFSYLEKELKFFASKNVTHIIMGCPVFNLSHQHFTKILDMIREFLPETLFEIQIRPDLLSKEDIELLSEMNVFLNFGLQTTKQKVHENIMTSLNTENALCNIKYMANFPALPFGIDVIAGLPKMNFNDFLNDLEAVFNLWPVRMNVFRLSMYPGTRIYNRIREFGYTVEHTYPYRSLENPEFSRREFEKVDEISEGIDLVYNRGRMVSVITMLSKGLEMPCHEIILRWNKWIRKQSPEIASADPDEVSYDELFGHIIEFFCYLFDRFQKKKLWSAALDLLKHNHFYTSSLMDINDDIISFPYQISSIDKNSVIAMNSSSFFDRFSYNIEDIIETGYIDLKKYSSDVDKENLFGLVYRLDGAVFTKSITDEEGAIFTHIRKKESVSIGELEKKFRNIDVLGIISDWCEEGVLYISV